MTPSTTPTARAIPAASSVVTAEQARQYHEQGYMILPGVLDDETLTMLREECHYFVGYQDAKLDAAGKAVQGITHRGQRYFIGNQYHLSHRLWRFIYGEVMADVCRATLGDEAQLFNEQWVVKGPDKGMKFAWHQDSGYVTARDPQAKHRPYLTVWTALDDVDESNGTVYVLPHDRAGTRDQIKDHTREEGTNDLIGYTGDDPGDPVVCPAASVAFFTSHTLHCSGNNPSGRFRRVYLMQYSSEVIRSPEDGRPYHRHEPLYIDGRRILRAE